jgi:hypothetical protein
LSDWNMTLGLDSVFLTAARFIASFLLEKILLRFHQLPGQSLAPGVPAGAAGTSWRLARYRRSER